MTIDTTYSIHVFTTEGRHAADTVTADKTKVEVAASDTSVEADLKQKITKAKSINAVTDLMLHADTQKILNDLPEGVRDEIRDFAKARLVELGWPTKKAA